MIVLALFFLLFSYSKAGIPCVPECKANSSCNSNIGYCECDEGFEGNPYRNCVKKCETPDDCEMNQRCIQKTCRNPCEEDCGVNSECTVKHHISICQCPKGFSGDPSVICRNASTAANVCEECGGNSVCIIDGNRGNYSENCMCQRGFIGNPYKSCEKFCLRDNDCPADETCSYLHTCRNPCRGEICGVNAVCTLQKYTRKPKCECRDGFVGDPTRKCALIIYTRPFGTWRCSPSCGPNATCDAEYSVCRCNRGFSGNPYKGCTQVRGCESNSDCEDTKWCENRKCKDPCVNSCGRNATCSTKNHEATCKCPSGFSGNPLEVCTEDICKITVCGKNAICEDGFCNCLPGYSGNFYEECTINSPPPKNNCGGLNCGINAICKNLTLVSICSCSGNYTGNPFKLCKPKIETVLFNPGRVPCLNCICKSLTGTKDIIKCAKTSISFGYWEFAGENLVGIGEQFRTQNSTVDFITCMDDENCILNTMNDYISRVLHRLNDIDCDGKLTCADYFAAHKFGLRAKLTDSIFTKTQIETFNKCSGEKISDDWVPKNCVGLNYTELLS